MEKKAYLVYFRRQELFWKEIDLALFQSQVVSVLEELLVVFDQSMAFWHSLDEDLDSEFAHKLCTQLLLQNDLILAHDEVLRMTFAHNRLLVLFEF